MQIFRNRSSRHFVLPNLGGRAVKAREAIARALTEPAMRETLLDQGLDVAASTQQEFADVFPAEIAKWAKVVQSVGIELM